MMELLHALLNFGLALVVFAMVICIAMAVWITRRRHKSYENYLEARRRIEQGTAIVPSHIEPSTPWPRK